MYHLQHFVNYIIRILFELQTIFCFSDNIFSYIRNTLKVFETYSNLFLVSFYYFLFTFRNHNGMMLINSTDLYPKEKEWFYDLQRKF